MILIKKGRVIDPKTGFDQIADVLIQDKQIIRIARDIDEKGAEVIDAEGLVVAPGLIDIHVHFREPGQTQKETIHTGALAAARGGFTTVVMMANTKPILSHPEVLSETLKLASQEKIHIKSIASITEDFDGQHLTDFEALLEAGAVGFSDDGIPLSDSGVLHEALKKAKETNSLLSIHEEDPKLVDTLGINEGEVAHQCGLTGATTVAEYSMIARDAMLALDTQARLHIQHLSAGESVDVVRFAQKMGAKISAEVTPQHFSLTEEAVLERGTNAKLNPPLRRATDIEKIIEGLKDNTITVIATDHAPHTQEEKNVPLAQAPSGMIGLETSLQLGLTHLVATKHLSLLQLLEKMTVNPATLYGFDAGYLAEGGPADVVIFDASKAYKVDASFASKASNSPFINQELIGQVKYTLCSGEIVYRS